MEFTKEVFDKMVEAIMDDELANKSLRERLPFYIPPRQSTSMPKVSFAQELLLLQEQEATKKYSSITPQMLQGLSENPIPRAWQEEYPPKYDVLKADTLSMVQWYDNTDPIKQTGGKKIEP